VGLSSDSDAGELERIRFLECSASESVEEGDLAAICRLGAMKKEDRRVNLRTWENDIVNTCNDIYVKANCRCIDRGKELFRDLIVTDSN